MSNSITIIYAADTETYAPVKLKAGNLREILSLLKLHYGEEFTNKLLQEKFFYVLADSNDVRKPIGLLPEVLFSDLPNYDQLLIIPDVEGNAFIGTVVWAYTMMALTYVGVGATTAALIAEGVVLLASMALSIGASMLMNALSPTPEFSSDPAAAQQNSSKLFNGTQITREQGGPIPLGFGRPFHGGTLISSGLFSEDVNG